MKQPQFSIVLPTKNRSFLVGYAIRSVLQQSCPDWELIISDNDDTEQTRAVVDGFPDRRIRYHRTGGLNMPDNWEAGIRQTHGDYVLLLEDKQLLKRNALEQLAAFTARQSAACVTWPYDTLDDAGRVPIANRIVGSAGATRYASETVLSLFLNEFRRPYMYILPRGVNCAIHRSLIERMVAGPVGRVCPPVTPDFTMGFQTLAYTSEIWHLHRSLSVIAGLRYSNGRSFKRKEELGRRFLGEFGRDESMCYDRVPIKTLLVSVLLANDYAHIREKVQGSLAPHPINPLQLFVDAWLDIQGAEHFGTDMAEERQAWEDGLRGLSSDDIARIRAMTINGPPSGPPRSGLDYFAQRIKSRLFKDPTRYLVCDEVSRICFDRLARPFLRHKARRRAKG